MPTIMDFYNSGLTAAGNQTRDRYLAPQLQANLYKSQTENQFLPEKLRLANQYQGLINQYYGPTAESDIAYKKSETNKNNITNQYLPEKLRADNEYQNKVNSRYIPNIDSEIAYRNTENKFTPLKYAIEAENSRRNGSRFGDASNLIRSIASMKSGDKEIYLSDPENYDAYMNALKQTQQGINSPQESIINPQFLQKFGLAAGMTGSPSSQQPNSMATGGQQQPPSAGLAAPHPAVQQAVIDHIADNAPNKELDQKERRFLAHQSLANAKLAGTPLWTRAQGAVVLERFLNDNQKVFAPRIENAAKYAGALGRGKLFADRLAKESPDTYLDYQWVMKDFIPNLGNNVKVMEKLASSDQQRKALNEMQSAALGWDVDPKGAVKLLNMGFDLFHSQAKATLDAAQPINPGVLEKLNGIKSDAGDYVGQKSNAKKPRVRTYNLATGSFDG